MLLVFKKRLLLSKVFLGLVNKKDKDKVFFIAFVVPVTIRIVIVTSNIRYKTEKTDTDNHRPTSPRSRCVSAASTYCHRKCLTPFLPVWDFLSLHPLSLPSVSCGGTGVGGCLDPLPLSGEPTSDSFRLCLITYWYFNFIPLNLFCICWKKKKKICHLGWRSTEIERTHPQIVGTGMLSDEQGPTSFCGKWNSGKG